MGRSEPTGQRRSLEERAALHRALGDPSRLAIIDALALSDRSPSELGALTELPTNLLAFHLRTLQDAGLVARTASQGDGRRRYVTLVRDRLDHLYEPAPTPLRADRVLFVCTANSARSQLAAGLWQARTGRPALSAGTDPAPEVHPRAVEVARDHDLDLEGAVPTSYAAIDDDPDLVVSVCDRAHESALPFGAPVLHWSIPDPVGGDAAGFTVAFEAIAARVDHLARATAGVA